jgi:hypothetical protein
VAEPESEGEILRRLEHRLEQASSVAERLIAEAARASASSAERLADAAAAAARAAEPPPAGWQAPEGDATREARSGELEVLVQFLRSVRDLVPPELQRRLAEALRELLVAVRALIDWYLERVDRRRASAPEVRDIPIQ